MSVIKEYKEFFLRNTPVIGGGKPDKENNFPTQYTITTTDGAKQVYNRFLKGHFPSEAVFVKFLESIGFKLNPEDTATTEMQGLARIATGYNVWQRLDTNAFDENGTIHKFTTFVIPSELPKVTGDNVTVVIRKASDDSIVPSIAANDRDIYYLEYQVADNIGGSSMLLDYDSLTAVPGNFPDFDGTPGLGKALSQVTIPADFFTTDSDYLEFEVISQKTDGASVNMPPTLLFQVGASGAATTLGAEIWGAGLSPNIVDNQEAIAHVITKIYRTGATTAKVIQTFRYYKTTNNIYGTAAYKQSGGAGTQDSEQAIAIHTSNLTIDWAADQLFTLYTIAVGGEPHTITSFSKAYRD